MDLEQWSSQLRHNKRCLRHCCNLSDGESPTPQVVTEPAEFKVQDSSKMDAISYGFALMVLSGGVMGYMKAGKDS